MNPSALDSFISGSIGLLAVAGLAPVILRFKREIAPVTRLAALGLFVHAVTVGLTFYFAPTAMYWHGAALYWFGFHWLLWCFCAVYKSVSLSMLSQLGEAEGHSMLLDEIVEQKVQRCFSDRTALLVKSGLANEQNGRFSISEAGRRMAGKLAFWQRLFGIWRCGLYAPPSAAPLPVNAVKDPAAENRRCA